MLRFPLGHMMKADVRRLAEEMGLPVAGKSDSQDICFVPSGRYTDVVAKLRPDAVKAGDIVDTDGNLLGRHEGIIHFTVGQRRGLGIASGEPLYVVRLDAAGQRVVVGPRQALETTELMLKHVNWLASDILPASPSDDSRAGMEDALDVYARVRSSQPPRSARIVLNRTTGEVHVNLVGGEYGVATGQACVFYDGEGPGARLLGGGWIAGTTSKSQATATAGAARISPAAMTH